MAFVRGPFGLRSYAARYWSRGTVFAAALVCMVWGDAAGSAIVPVPPGKLVANGDDGLYVLNTNGTGLRRITRSDFDHDPVWSPDGSRIVFERIGGRGATLMIVGSDGSGLRVLPNHVALAPQPRWSPDGKRLAYGGCGGFCVLDLVTGARKSFVSDETVGVDWSPDGTRIVFGGTAALNVVNVETNARTIIALPSATGGAWRPAWSSDGSTIAFLGSDDERLYVAAVAGGGVRSLANASSVEVATPDWAPNAPLIAYTHDEAVHVISATSRRDVRLSDDRFVAQDPSWTTNGEGVIFARTRIPGSFGETDLWYVALSGGARRITSPYPSGAAFTEPDFAKGSVRAVRAARGQRELKLSTVASHTIKNEIVAVVPAGAGAAVATLGKFHNTCGPNLVWNPPSRRVIGVPDDCGDAQGINALAAAPGLVAWSYCQQTFTTDFCALVAARPGAPPRTLAGGEGVPQPGNLHGDGALVVFQTWRGKRHPTTLWHVVADPKPRIERLAERPFTDDIVAVDGGKILLRESARKLTLLDARARPIRSLHVRTALGDGIFLTGDTLVVVRSGSISVFDARSGRLRHRWRLVGDAPWVESVRGDLAAYVSGIALHLFRLDTGVDRIVALPRVGARPSAALSRRGLFVGYSAIDSPRRRLLLLRIP
jgi:Tol biopolymer transport system component